MRGKVHRCTIDKRPERITPAYAGKSLTLAMYFFIFFRITPAYAGKSFFFRKSRRL